MAIKPPSWCKDAIPTLKGWVHPQTGEALVSGSITQKDIDEYFGKVAEETLPEPMVIEVDDDSEVEWIPNEVDDVIYEEDEDWEDAEIDLDSMTKAELIETAEEWEIEIDPKSTKAEIKAILEEELFE